MAKVVVVIEGGIVTDILSTEPVEVAVIDYDIESAEAEDLKKIPMLDGVTVDATGSVREADVSPARAEELFAAAN